MDMLMQIGQGVQWTGRAHPVLVLLWGLPNYVALSTTEAEYIALCLAFHEVVCLRKLLVELFGHEMDSTLSIVITRAV
jgi:hypothetical protein